MFNRTSLLEQCSRVFFGDIHQQTIKLLQKIRKTKIEFVHSRFTDYINLHTVIKTISLDVMCFSPQNLHTFFNVHNWRIA